MAEMAVGSITNGLPLGAYLGAAAILAAVLAITHGVAKAGGGGKGLASLVIGVDGRTSTSKLAPALWTVAIIYALAALLLDGRTSFEPLEEEYLLLLGGPYAAAVGAKVSTSTKVAEGRERKVPTQKTGKTSRLAEIVTNDRGDIDLGDYQYFAFTLLTIFFFLVAFVQDPDGLPDLPNTLVGLSTVSAAAYLTKKVAITDSTDAFRVVSVRPTKIMLGETRRLVISGRGFLEKGHAETANAVLLDGVALEVDDWTANSVKADIINWAGNGLVENQQAELVVHNSAGQPSKPFAVQVFEPPS